MDVPEVLNALRPLLLGPNSLSSVDATAFQFLLLCSFTSASKRMSSNWVQSFEVYAPAPGGRTAGRATATADATGAALPDALAAALPALAKILSPSCGIWPAEKLAFRNHFFFAPKSTDTKF